MKTITVAMPPCIVCNKQTTFALRKRKYDRWIRGELVQNVFPQMDPEKREQLISGTCPGKCQDELFGGTNDD